MIDEGEFKDELEQDFKKAMRYDNIKFENPDRLREIDKKNNLLSRRGAHITLHDVASFIKFIDISMQRGIVQDPGEKEDIIALKQRLIKFLNLATPENYDILADAELTQKFAEEERARIEATRRPDGSLPADDDKQKKTGGAPFPI